jgi:hypothetical protein
MKGLELEFIPAGFIEAKTCAAHRPIRILTVSDLDGLVYPYPTFSGMTKSMAVEFLKPSAQNPWLRRPIGFLRR